MVAFLSREWLDALDRTASASPKLRGLVGEGDRVVVEQHVESDDDEVVYAVVISSHGARVFAGPTEDATVRFTQDLATATGIARGTLSAQRAFMTGRLRVGGDLRALVAQGELLAALDDVFAPVRADTEFPPVDEAAVDEATVDQDHDPNDPDDATREDVDA